MGKQRLAATIVALVMVVGASPVPHASAGTVDARVRVNQVGYVTDGPKRAFVISSGGCGGTAFELRDDADTAVLSGNAGEDGGSWNATVPWGASNILRPGLFPREGASWEPRAFAVRGWMVPLSCISFR